MSFRILHHVHTLLQHHGLATILLQVKIQANGKLTVVMTSKDGSTVEIADNDQVLMATGGEDYFNFFTMWLSFV